jgi:crotonobetainyl-CoA:carnitine CoA-transferase CaiB-like acyl-CoA transferase
MRGLSVIGAEAAGASGLFTEADLALIRHGDAPPLRSRLRVAELAEDAVALASLALGLLRGPGPAVTVDGRAVAASFGSERLIRIDGVAPPVWAPLSGFWRTADGWVRTHGNYSHHAERLRRLLGVGADADRDTVSAAIADWESLALEDAAADAGALAVAVRSPEEWRGHPQGAAVAQAPLIRSEKTTDAPPKPHPAGALPLSGVRVLDLTRVIAGPVATRDLAFAGADVLRVDAPQLAEIDWGHIDTGQGKRSTLLDLADRRDRAEFDRLLAAADVLVTGYRPGALALLGLGAEEVAARHPSLLGGEVSAWGSTGPWGGRRGFDSLVQAATGIAVEESPDGATPGALPVQALDHSAGHFLAAAIAGALRAQRREGGGWRVAVSLARVAQALLDGSISPAGGPVEAASRDDAELPVIRVASSAVAGRLITCAPPVLSFPDAPTAYAWVDRGWGTDAPAWRPVSSPAAAELR